MGYPWAREVYKTLSLFRTLKDILVTRFIHGDKFISISLKAVRHNATTWAQSREQHITLHGDTAFNRFSIFISPNKSLPGHHQHVLIATEPNT